ncbi:epidermal retinol dehydrogenase 2-like [Glandiceps talaboti]
MNRLVEFVKSLYVAHVAIILSVIHFFFPRTRKSIAGEIVLLTGAGGGIGRLMSMNFARQGATLVLWDINKEGVDETAKQIRQIGGKAHSYVCDVTKREEVYRVAEQVTKDVGNVTILVNNAGVAYGKRLLDNSDEQIERTMNVNTMAHFWTLKAFLPSMISKNHGHIVTIASIMGSAPGARLTDYCASKFAAVGLHESLHLELAAENATGVHTTLVQPYQIDTGMFSGVYIDILPPLEPQYVADKVLDAVLRNDRVIMMPRLMYVIPLLKSFLPVDCTAALYEGLGFSTAMNTFIGRQKKEA